jgi:hypothetical protein
MKMRGVRQLARAVAVVAVVGSAIVVTAGEAWAAPAVTVSPDTDLVDLQEVSVDGEGFTPLAFVGIVQCEAAAATPDGCDLSNVATTDVDAAGAFTGALFTVRRIITTANGGDIDCASAPCIVVAANAADFGESVGAPVSFDPNVPPTPDLVVEVTIDTTGTVVSKTGLVTLTGTLTCNGPAYGYMEVFARQRAGRVFIDGGGFVEIECDTTTTTWTIPAVGGNGIFKAGTITVQAFSFVTDGTQEDSDSEVATVRLRGRRP